MSTYIIEMLVAKYGATMIYLKYTMPELGLPRFGKKLIIMHKMDNVNKS